MPLRNPFARRGHDENSRPAGDRTASSGFERVDTIGSLPSSALSTLSRRSQDTSQDAGEFKLSVVNDSGVYLPPSPTEEKGAWPRRYFSRASSDTKSSTAGDIEPFSISRESFDSYRRSFDISAKSPIATPSLPPRQSLDSARLYSRSRRTPLRSDGNSTPEEVEDDVLAARDDAEFEDVGLEDNWVKPMPPPPPRRRGFFAKFAETSSATATATAASADASKEAASASGSGSTGSGMVGRFLMPGRRRGHSQNGKESGAELGNIAGKGDAGDAMDVH